jgi:hypothetical protein
MCSPAAHHGRGTQVVDDRSDVEDQRLILSALFADPTAPYDTFMAIPFGHLKCRLPKALDLMFSSSCRWILINETRDGFYLQFLATENGAVISECVSNEYRPPESMLSVDMEETLPTLGWNWPAPPNQMNWQTIEYDQERVLDSANLATHTLRRIIGCQDDDLMRAKLTRSLNTQRDPR